MPRRRLLRIALRLGLVLASAVLLPELALRFLLFSDLSFARSLGAPLRKAELFAVPQSREHWALQARFGKLARKFAPMLDPVLGYRSEAIDPKTLRHADEEELRGRRPVLLYGDSFAQCVTGPEECWQGLMEGSGLAHDYALLNYGVGGYGFDQSVLLLERTVDLYRELDPVVIVSLLVDDDLDRCFLLVRGHPKPHFELEQDELALYPPPPVSSAGFIEAPIEIRSYLWNWILYGSGLVSAQQRERWLPASERDAVVRELSERLIRRVNEELAGLDHFFLLFHAGPAAKEAGPYTWRERFLYETLECERIPFVTSKRYLWEGANAEGHPLGDFFISPDAKHGKNHLTADANRLVFEAIRAGLEGRFEPYAYLPGVPPPSDVVPARR